jgi:hypothetical protein
MRYAMNLFRLLDLQAPRVTRGLTETQVQGLLKTVAAAPNAAAQIQILKDFISSHGGVLDYAPETIESAPYATAISTAGNPPEFAGINIQRMIQTGASWASSYPSNSQTVEELLEQRKNPNYLLKTP